MPDPDIAGYRFTESGLNESLDICCLRYFACWIDATSLPASSDHSRLGSGDGSVATN
jgi:hypothetical protein